MYLNNSIIACLCFTFVCWLFIFLRRVPRRPHAPLPPGPSIPWWRLWGRGLRMPQTSNFPWLTYVQWQQTYGDMMYISIFRNPILVLNSGRAAQDLLEKRSAIYSSRPVRTMQADLMGFSFMFTGMAYDSRYKEHKSMFHRHFQPKMLPNYQSLQLRHTHSLLRNLTRSTNSLEYNLRSTTAAIVLEICYGYQISDQDDEFVRLADKAMLGMTQSGTFGSYMVDYLPILKYVPAWMPGATFKKKAAQWKRLALSMVNSPFSMVQEKMENGTALPCLATTELEKLLQNDAAKRADRESLIKNVAATTYAAGSDTTMSILTSFCLAMVLYPDIQKKARAELDRVVPGDRLPLFSDRTQLPFMECLIWECLRWNPVVNISLAHYSTEDDEYRGFRIPKGTTVLGNIWAILHDPEVYPDPLSFSPQRFANPKKNLENNINPLPEAAFGFGRRSCPGRPFALDTIWAVTTSMLYVFEFLKAQDDTGRDIEPKVEFTSGLFSRPKPFKYRLVPRSERAKTLIEETINDS